MKLRIRGNSVRLRLTQSEVVKLGQKGKIEERVEFSASSAFTYALETTDAPNTGAAFENNGLRVFIPEAQADDWISSNEVGIRAEQLIGGGKTLRILVEKDFACLEERPEEDETDAFPHPEMGKTC